ncbi:MAG: hypothetical protein ABSB95_07215 [Dissulfurispiraceae bacterium]|jgi:hypothetical protein
MNEENEHLSLNTVRFFIDGGTLDTESKRHIATCGKCFGVYRDLKTVGKGIQRSFKDAQTTASCPQDWELGSYIKNEATPHMRETLAGHIMQCDCCLDRTALYYKALDADAQAIATPVEWKTKALQALTEQGAANRQRASVFERIKSYITGFASSLPPAPGYAMAAAVTIVLLITLNMPEKNTIIPIESTEKLTVRDSEVPSSFGFTGTGVTREVSYMEITQAGHEIVFKWKPVDNAATYTFSIKEKRDGKAIYSRTTNNAKVSLDRKMIMRRRQYSWYITGELNNGQYFEYTGDFILAK